MFAEWKLLLLFCRLALAVKDFDPGPEPEHAKQDYDILEEVRGHDNETEAEKPAEDEHLTREAILDVAYYLRRFKFSGYDPRYLAEGEIPRRNLFVEFPSPPLRNIHWEVRKNCEPSFVECVRYLREQVSQAVLPRSLDSLTITKQNGWSFITDRNLIKSADDECLRLLQSDETAYGSFSGPVQRFKWLASASYYMCYYTMKEVAYLRNFTEDCDNHGSCIQWDLGLNNGDVRADNRQPFACATYSFCPDPCCPLKHLPDRSACDKETPCVDAHSTDKTCSFSRSENSHFESLTLNRWNISCICDLPGMRWESKSGMCVDVDECIELKSPCDFPSETCRNLQGKHKCSCSALGYRSNPSTGACEADPVLHHVFQERQSSLNRSTESLSGRMSGNFRSFLEKLKSIFRMRFSRAEENLNRTQSKPSEAKSVVDVQWKARPSPSISRRSPSASSLPVPFHKIGKF